MPDPGASAALLDDLGRVSFLIDPSMYAAGNAVPQEVYADLDRVVRTDLRHHYSGPVCAQRWLDVCDDPAYGHRGLIAFVGESCPPIAAALRADRPGVSGVAVVSLGPGDGSLDERLLAGLDGELGVVSYAGFDFSFELLRRAVHRFAADGRAGGRFPITVVCGDFMHAVPVAGPAADGGARLFTLTGLTIGNYREDVLLGQLYGMMRAGDYLLLDARLHRQASGPVEPTASRAILASYDRESVRRFVFGPVEVATTASCEDVAFGFEITRSLTAVPHAFNVVIYCTGLDARMRLTGERVRRDRLDLALTTMYHGPELAAWLPTTGFSVAWQRASDGLALFLLRRD